MKYKQRLLRMRERVKMIDGIPLIPKRWVLAYLLPSEIKKFEKARGWVLMKGKEEGKVRRYAYFWDIEWILSNSKE